jgi:hypothetical protein
MKSVKTGIGSEMDTETVPTDPARIAASYQSLARIISRVPQRCISNVYEPRSAHFAESCRLIDVGELSAGNEARAGLRSGSAPAMVPQETAVIARCDEQHLLLEIGNLDYSVLSTARQADGAINDWEEDCIMPVLSFVRKMSRLLSIGGLKKFRPDVYPIEFSIPI